MGHGLHIRIFRERTWWPYVCVLAPKFGNLPPKRRLRRRDRERNRRLQRRLRRLVSPFSRTRDCGFIIGVERLVFGTTCKTGGTVIGSVPCPRFSSREPALDSRVGLPAKIRQ